MTKVSDQEIIDTIEDLERDAVFPPAHIIPMLQELQEARKTLGKLKRISSAKTYVDNEYTYLPGFARSQAKKRAIAEVSDAVGNYIFTDAVHHEGIDTIIAGIYVLDNSK